MDFDTWLGRLKELRTYNNLYNYLINLRNSKIITHLEFDELVEGLHKEQRKALSLGPKPRGGDY